VVAVWRAWRFANGAPGCGWAAELEPRNVGGACARTKLMCAVAPRALTRALAASPVGTMRTDGAVRVPCVDSDSLLPCCLSGSG
jgi:hypothetical protein